MTTPRYDVFETALGWVGVIATNVGVSRVSLPEDSEAECTSSLTATELNAVRDATSVLDIRELLIEYFEGCNRGFEDVKVDIPYSSTFHQKAMTACRRIPYGETRTYRWLASRAGTPAGSRAAGQTMARNPVPVVVPCHRVVGSDGSLRGFGKGDTRLDLKRKLLDLETAGRRLF